MTNRDTAIQIRRWCDAPYARNFSWPTDACGDDQHIKFVEHRNRHWHGQDINEFVAFARAYADALETQPDAIEACVSE